MWSRQRDCAGPADARLLPQGRGLGGSVPVPPAACRGRLLLIPLSLPQAPKGYVLLPGESPLSFDPHTPNLARMHNC